MNNHTMALSIVLLSTLGCSTSGGDTGGSGGGSTASTSGGSVEDVRGQRYCEVLVGKLDGSVVHVEVYNTFLLNDCPEDAWKALDPAQIKADQGADAIVLNGPRYWLMDSFVNSKLIDTTPVTFGSLEMRLSGELDVPLSEAMGGEKAYKTRTVARATTFVYDAGKPVYELVDPQGQIYDMQSYSVQHVMQTEASLEDLGATLTLPSGWQLRSRTLDAPLSVTAVNGMATIVQDDVANTYQLSQQ